MTEPGTGEEGALVLPACQFIKLAAKLGFFRHPDTESGPIPDQGLVCHLEGRASLVYVGHEETSIDEPARHPRKEGGLSVQ